MVRPLVRLSVSHRWPGPAVPSAVSDFTCLSLPFTPSSLMFELGGKASVFIIIIPSSRLRSAATLFRHRPIVRRVRAAQPTHVACQTPPGTANRREQPGKFNVGRGCVAGRAAGSCVVLFFNFAQGIRPPEGVPIPPRLTRVVTGGIMPAVRRAAKASLASARKASLRKDVIFIAKVGRGATQAPPQQKGQRRIERRRAVGPHAPSHTRHL